jgi:hypothetical protein
LSIDNDDDGGDAMVSESMTTTMIPLPGAIRMGGGGGGPSGVYYSPPNPLDQNERQAGKFQRCWLMMTMTVVMPWYPNQ